MAKNADKNARLWYYHKRLGKMIQALFIVCFVLTIVLHAFLRTTIWGGFIFLSLWKKQIRKGYFKLYI